MSKTSEFSSPIRHKNTQRKQYGSYKCRRYSHFRADSHAVCCSGLEIAAVCYLIRQGEVDLISPMGECTRAARANYLASRVRRSPTLSADPQAQIGSLVTADIEKHSGYVRL